MSPILIITITLLAVNAQASQSTVAGFALAVGYNKLSQLVNYFALPATNDERCRQSRAACVFKVCEEIIALPNATVPNGCRNPFDQNVCANEVSAHPLYATCMGNDIQNCFVDSQLSYMATKLDETEKNLTQQLKEMPTKEDLDKKLNISSLHTVLARIEFQTNHQIQESELATATRISAAMQKLRDDDLNALRQHILHLEAQLASKANQASVVAVQTSITDVRNVLDTKASQDSVNEVINDVKFWKQIVGWGHDVGQFVSDQITSTRREVLFCIVLIVAVLIYMKYRTPSITVSTPPPPVSVPVQTQSSPVPVQVAPVVSGEVAPAVIRAKKPSRVRVPGAGIPVRRSTRRVA